MNAQKVFRSTARLIILGITVAFLYGCSTTRHSSMERYGVVMSRAGPWGSFVVAGNGYAYLARHVVLKDSVTVGEFTLFFNEGVDSLATVVSSEGDVLLVRTRLGRSLPLIKYAGVSYAEEVVFIQPHFSRKHVPHFYVLVSKTARYEKEARQWYVDHAVYPGISGSGVWSKGEELVGMMHMIVGYEGGAIYGIFTPIPNRLVQLIVPLPKPMEGGVP